MLTAGGILIAMWLLFSVYASFGPAPDVDRTDSKTWQERVEAGCAIRDPYGWRMTPECLEGGAGGRQ